MGRKPCCWRVGLTKGAWTSSEDKILINYITTHGATNWRDLPRKAGLNRCGKSCRLRWLNYLKPDIKRGHISPDEEDLIIRLHKLLGNRWSLIAGRLPGRTDNEIKNHWKSKLSKRVSNNDRDHTDQTIVDVKHSTNLLKYKKNHKVIRTRAMRCTKVIDIPYPQNNRFQNDQNSSHNGLSPDKNIDLPMTIDLDGMFVNDDHHDSVEACDADHWMSSWDQQHDTLQGNGAMDLNYLATILNSDDEEWFHQITSNQ